MASAPKPAYSIVICSIDEDKFRKVCDNYNALFSGVPIEIIGIHDARSLAEGYNRGIARARGEYLILSHDDIQIVTPDFAQRLTDHLTQFDLIGVAGTTRLIGGAWFLAGHPYSFQFMVIPDTESGRLVMVLRGRGPLTIASVQALDGMFMGMRTHVAKDLLFDDKTFDHFHLYDIDFSYRAHLKGYRIAVCRDLFIIHESPGKFDLLWQEYRSRFERKFSAELDGNVPVVESHVQRIEFDPAYLNDENLVRWLCNPDSISKLLDDLPDTMTAA